MLPKLFYDRYQPIAKAIDVLSRAVATQLQLENRPVRLAHEWEPLDEGSRGNFVECIGKS